MSVWDERDLPQKRQQGQNPRATGEFQAMGRVTGTAPVVKRPDGTTYLPAGSVYNEKYATIQVLGEGGISIVYKARHAVMKNLVAIKLLNGTYPSNAPVILRFQREGQAVSRLSHPCFVRTYEYGISREGQPFLVLDYLEGTSLAKLINERGPMPLSKALPVFIQVAEALAHAHGAGVNHLDLKPTNIFLTEPDSAEPKVKIFDFGLAECFDSVEADPNALIARVPWRSPLYMSPEQCQGRNLDDRSDVYGLGCLMYKALTGLPALKGDNFAQTMLKQEMEMPVPFTELAPDNEGLADIWPVVNKCLAKEPGSRYQTMAQLARALKEIRDRRIAKSAPVRDRQAENDAEEAQHKAVLVRNGLIAGGVALLLMGIGGVIYFIKSNAVEVNPPGPTSQACLELDKGHYGEAQKRFADLLTAAKISKSDEATNLCLSDQAVLNHILADKAAESTDDQGLTDLATARGEAVNAQGGEMSQIDTLLTGGKTGAELETELAKPVNSLIDQAQALAWNQKYNQAREVMSALPGKLSDKLGATSPLVLNVKIQYAMLLLQKIINPIAPLTTAQKQDLVSEPKALLEEPLNNCKETDLLLARSNFAAALALSGNVEEAKKQRDEVLANKTAATISGDKSACIETRLADLACLLDNNESALPLYQSAYNRFLNIKNYPAAVYCANAFCRTSRASGNARQSLDFLSGQMKNASILTPEAAPVKAEIQAWLAELNYRMTTEQFTKIQGKDFPKPPGDLMKEAERLGLESLYAMQEKRPSEQWLANPALDTVVKVYCSGNGVGKAVPILRVKQAVAERNGNERAADVARHNLGSALLSYGKNSMAQTFAKLDGIEVTGDKTDPKQEARVIFKQSTTSGGGVGDNHILWLDDSYIDLVGDIVEAETEKAETLVAAGAACNKTADMFGKTSKEYMNQLRGQGLLAFRLKHNDEAKKILIEARTVAQENPGLPLADRRNVYSDLIAVCEALKDANSVKTYTSEMQALPSQ